MPEKGPETVTRRQSGAPAGTSGMSRMSRMSRTVAGVAGVAGVPGVWPYRLGHRLARDKRTLAMADQGDLRHLRLIGKLPDRPSEFDRAVGQPGAVVISEARSLLAVKRQDLRESAELPGRAVAAVHQHGDGLVRIQMQATVRAVGAGSELRDLQHGVGRRQSARLEIGDDRQFGRGTADEQAEEHRQEGGALQRRVRRRDITALQARRPPPLGPIQAGNARRPGPRAVAGNCGCGWQRRPSPADREPDPSCRRP